MPTTQWLIEPGVGSLSPNNGNISNIRRRLSAIWLGKSPNSELGDRPPFCKCPPFTLGATRR